MRTGPKAYLYALLLCLVIAAVFGLVIWISILCGPVDIDWDMMP